MAVEVSINVYLESKKNLKAKITAIDCLIDAMFLKMTEAVNGQSPIITEYMMDDGQMKVKTIYRSIKDVEAGISALEKLKQRYLNRFNGRSFVLRDARGLGR